MSTPITVKQQEKFINRLCPTTQPIARWMVHTGGVSWDELAKMSRRNKEAHSFGFEIAMCACDHVSIDAKNMACRIARVDPMDWTQFDAESVAGAKLLSSGCVAKEESGYAISHDFLRALRFLYSIGTKAERIPGYIE